MNVFRTIARALGRDVLPDGAVGALDEDEHELAWAASGEDGHVVATTHGLWIPGDDGPRRVGWHLVSKATWQNGSIVLVEAVERETIDGAVLLADLAPRRLRLAEPGRVPQVVHERVTGSIRTRHRRDLPGGGAWFVQRKVAGTGGFVLQVRPDPGTDDAPLRGLVGEVARTLRLDR